MTRRPKPRGRYWLSPRMRKALVAVAAASAGNPVGWISQPAFYRLIGKHATHIAVALVRRELALELTTSPMRTFALAIDGDEPTPPFYRLSGRGRAEAIRIAALAAAVEARASRPRRRVSI